jgi:hypothetical protein
MQKNSAPIVGAWKLIVFEFLKSDGNIIYPFGEKANGCIIYADTGRYSAQLMRNDRPRFQAGDQMKGTADEIEASFKGCISYFGSYEFNAEGGYILHHVESSLFPNMDGSVQKRFFDLDGNRLQLKTQPIKLGGEQAVGILQWERIE